MTSSNGSIFRATGHLCGEFTGHRWIPRTKASDAELWCLLSSALNKRLRKQWWGWWFETPSYPLWRHSNDLRDLEVTISQWVYDSQYQFDGNIGLLSDFRSWNGSVVFAHTMKTQPSWHVQNFTSTLLPLFGWKKVYRIWIIIENR